MDRSVLLVYDFDTARDSVPKGTQERIVINNGVCRSKTAKKLDSDTEI